MEWKEYELKAHAWAQKKYNCKLTNKPYTLSFDGRVRKITPDFSSADGSVLGDAKSGSSDDPGELRTIGYTVLKMILIEKSLKRQCKKFLVFKNKEQAVEFRENMEGGLVLALLFKDSFEIWYWNDQTDEEEKLYPMS